MQLFPIRPHYRTAVILLLCYGACLLFFVQCRNTSTNPRLTVWAEQTALRQQAGPKSDLIRILEKGEVAFDALSVSDFLSPLQFGDTILEAPWIKLSEPAGWVYALDMAPAEGDRAAWLLQKNLQAILRPPLSARHKNWLQQSGQQAHAADLAIYFDSTFQLRTDIAHAIGHRPERNKSEYNPNFSWLSSVLPGMILQWNDAGEPPYPYFNFAYFARLASTTPEASDDRFFSLCCSMYPVDSIESAAPVWTWPTSITETYSLLGKGIHLETICQIDTLLASSPEFQGALTRIKTNILSDILDKNRVYWLEEAPIRQELDQLLERAPACLTQREILALEERRKMFDNPMANGIRVNARGGM